MAAKELKIGLLGCGTVGRGLVDDSKHYLRFAVGDPSAIGPIATIPERNGIGVARAAAVWAKGLCAQHQVRVLTYTCPRSTVETALREIAGLGIETG